MTHCLVLISRPRGGCGYVVARFDNDLMRIAHQPDLASAKTLEREWLRGDFSFDPGTTRRLNSNLIHSTEPRP